MAPRPLVCLALVVTIAAALTACGGGSTPAADPATAMKTAEHELEDTSGVRFALRTDDLPDGVEGVTSASGTITDAPAFQGTLGAVTSLGSVSVPVIAVDGKVYAKIPLTLSYAEVNPDDYGAPDPAQLIDGTDGIPAILSATTGLKAGDRVRGGTDHKEILTSYTGSVPGSAVRKLIPTAIGTFAATYRIASDGELREASLTGAFNGPDRMTYALTLTDYGTSQDISAP
jgi:lipoprotein LprG